MTLQGITLHQINFLYIEPLLAKGQRISIEKAQCRQQLEQSVLSRLSTTDAYVPLNTLTDTLQVCALTEIVEDERQLKIGVHTINEKTLKRDKTREHANG